MMYPELPMPAHASNGRIYRRLVVVALTAVAIAKGLGVASRASARPVIDHLRDHIYTIIGFGMFDAAMFVHSLYTGLWVGGILFGVFEWKVSDE